MEELCVKRWLFYGSEGRGHSDSTIEHVKIHSEQPDQTLRKKSTPLTTGNSIEICSFGFMRFHKHRKKTDQDARSWNAQRNGADCRIAESAEAVIHAPEFLFYAVMGFY